MAARTEWDDLPGAVRDAIESRTGAVVAAHSIRDGLNCAAALRLTTRDGVTFVKGAPVGGPCADAWEARINSCVRRMSPQLRWRIVVDGWDLLGFENIDGRHADLSSGSTDLKLMAQLLHESQSVRVPDIGLPRFADRWRPFLDDRRLELLDGSDLLHTDINQHNVMIAADRAYLVDWATPAVGPAWVDVACTAVRLMEDDCPPVEARAWAAQFPCWNAAPPEAVMAFVTANCRQWECVVGTEDARPSNARFAQLLPTEESVPDPAPRAPRPGQPKCW